MPFHLESLWSATLMPHRACAMDWDKTIIMSVGKNSGPVLSRLWTKVHEILRPFVLSNALARLSMSRFVQQIFAIKSRSRRKPNKCTSCLAPFFRERRSQLFYDRLLARPTDQCGWVPFTDLCLRSLAMKWNACRFYRGWVKTHFRFEAVCGPKFMSFWDRVAEPS